MIGVSVPVSRGLWISGWGPASDTKIKNREFSPKSGARLDAISRNQAGTFCVYPDSQPKACLLRLSASGQHEKPTCAPRFDSPPCRFRFRHIAISLVPPMLTHVHYPQVKVLYVKDLSESALDAKLRKLFVNYGEIRPSIRAFLRFFPSPPSPPFC